MSDMKALADRLREGTPFGADRRWAKSGEIADAAELDYWNHVIDRAAAILDHLAAAPSPLRNFWMDPPVGWQPWLDGLADLMGEAELTDWEDR